jgi:hypothetical protein
MSSWTKQARALTTSESDFAGWATPSECTYTTQHAHRKALRASNQENLTLLHAQLADIMQNMLMSEGTADADMGKYYDEID